MLLSKLPKKQHDMKSPKKKQHMK